MAATVTKLWNNSPYDDGLGVNSPLGTGFVRKCQMAFSAGTTSGDISASDFGAQVILDVLAVIPKSSAAYNVYVSGVTASAISLATSSNDTVEVVALVRGL